MGVSRKYFSSEADSGASVKMRSTVHDAAKPLTNDKVGVRNAEFVRGAREERSMTDCSFDAAPDSSAQPLYRHG